MKNTLSLAAAVAALMIATQAFAAGPAPAAAGATPAASSTSTSSAAAPSTAAPAAASTGQSAAPAAASTAAPAAQSSKHASSSSHVATSSKLDALTCADYQKRVDDAIAGSKDTAKIDHAKKDREEGVKLCGSGKHEEGVMHFRTALKDLRASKAQ
ncbi:MAG: hypothetical protein U1F33_02665 [Alphaproteobacteria bacterium]